MRVNLNKIHCGANFQAAQPKKSVNPYDAYVLLMKAYRQLSGGTVIETGKPLSGFNPSGRSTVSSAKTLQSGILSFVKTSL